MRRMLHRRDSNGLLVITQPAHALLSGQLARAWGNEAFGDFGPREEVCLAAALHDIGWLQWEAAPTFNTQTGLPHSFRELPMAEHAAIWSGAGRTAALVNRYAGLLISMHGTGLFQRAHESKRRSPEDREIVARFMSEQLALQRDWISALRSDPSRAHDCDEQNIEVNRRLIAAWDRMSLHLCLGFDDIAEIEEVPAHQAAVVVRMRVRDASNNIIEVDPWPFRDRRVAVNVEGRRLSGRFPDERTMRRAVRDAVPITFVAELTPAM